MCCVSWNYPELNSVLSKFFISNFVDPPLPLGNPIDKFGYEIGSPGIISVEIAANPKPKLEWSVRGETLREGGVDSTGRIQAEFAQELVS